MILAQALIHEGMKHTAFGVNAMGIKWGGKTIPKRDSVMEEGCLGEDPPEINGRKLTLGSVQKMTFDVGDYGPFYEPRALRHDVPMTPEEIVIEKRKRKKQRKVMITENESEEGEESLQDAPRTCIPVSKEETRELSR